MSKIKNGWLDQYGAEPFEQRQFGTAGVERVKGSTSTPLVSMASSVHILILQLLKGLSSAGQNAQISTLNFEIFLG